MEDVLHLSLNYMTPQEYQYRVDEFEKQMHLLRLSLDSAKGQRDRAREIADSLAPALRRCCDDSKDLLAKREFDSQWVQSNIDLAEKSLDLHEQKDW